MQFCEKEGVLQQLTTPYTPEQNGVAERKNRTVVQLARSMLKSRGMPKQYWAEVVAAAVYILNLSPTKAVLNKTPFEAWFGRKIGAGYLRVFGCVAYTLVSTQNRKKLDAKSEKCIFIGYCIQSKGYRLYNPMTKKIVVSRNVMFDESSSWNWNTGSDDVPVSIREEEEDEGNRQPETGRETDNTNLVPLRVYTRRTKQPVAPKTKTIQELYEATQVMYVSDPESYEEAADHKEWVYAMEEEMQAIEKNQTW